jgi:mannose-6-phosphate isomerase-like protein (cupin superfamily)
MARRAIVPENRASGISARNPISKEVHVGYTYVDIDTLEGEGPGGMVRKTRRPTGARAFGFNYFTLPPGVVGREHDHADSNQEEVYFVVRGDGTMRIDGDELELCPGRFVRVDPESTRVPIAGDDGLELVTFGAPLEGGYEPPDWG